MTRWGRNFDRRGGTFWGLRLVGAEGWEGEVFGKGTRELTLGHDGGVAILLAFGGREDLVQFEFGREEFRSRLREMQQLGGYASAQVV